MVINSIIGDGLVFFIGWILIDLNEEFLLLSIKGILDNIMIFLSVSIFFVGIYYFGVLSNWGVNYIEVEVELLG